MILRVCGLKLVEVWRRNGMWLQLSQEKLLKYFSDVIQSAD
jgi:hypothetical protein